MAGYVPLQVLPPSGGPSGSDTGPAKGWGKTHMELETITTAMPGKEATTTAPERSLDTPVKTMGEPAPGLTGSRSECESDQQHAEAEGSKWRWHSPGLMQHWRRTKKSDVMPELEFWQWKAKRLDRICMVVLLVLYVIAGVLLFLVPYLEYGRS